MCPESPWDPPSAVERHWGVSAPGTAGVRAHASNGEPRLRTRSPVPRGKDEPQPWHISGCPFCWFQGSKPASLWPRFWTNSSELPAKASELGLRLLRAARTGLWGQVDGEGLAWATGFSLMSRDCLALQDLGSRTGQASRSHSTESHRRPFPARLPGIEHAAG